MNSITISRGPCGTQLLECPAFCAQWTALCDRCAWSTSYQTPGFIAAWYRIYAQKFEPVIVVGRNETSALSGILCLAVSKEDGSLIVAGANQSEYQVWVTESGDGNDFVLRALLEVRKEFPEQHLQFCYLPPGAPLEWLSDPRIKSRMLLTKKPRPLLRFAEISTDSLSKTNNKKRLKGLKKLGEMEFRRLNSATELEAVFDDFANFYDLRLGAMHGVEPFALDPLKKAFQLELMKVPGLIHASVLEVGGRLASAQVNVCEKKQLHLSLIAHNPLLAKHSPGKFHIHMLSQMLVADGYEEIDLTPGGDPYKERFSTSHDMAHMLTLHPTALSRFKGSVRARGEALARRGLQMANIHPARARDILETAGSVDLEQISAMAARLRKRVSAGVETRLYARAIPQVPDDVVRSELVQRDSIEDALAYQEQPSGLSRKHFLFDAMNRMELGQRLYSCVRDGRLVYAGWLMEKPSEVFVSRIFPEFKLRPNSALIVDLVSYDLKTQLELGSACLAAMLNDLSRAGGIERVLIGISPKSREIAVLEMAGFSVHGSLFAKAGFGRVRRCGGLDVEVAALQPEQLRAAAVNHAGRHPRPHPPLRSSSIPIPHANGHCPPGSS